MKTITSKPIDYELVGYDDLRTCVANYGSGPEFYAVTTGYKDIDSDIEGLLTGGIYFVGGVRVMGKTAFILGSMRKILNDGVHVALITRDRPNKFFLNSVY